MSALFGPDLFSLVKYVLILAATLILVGAFYFALRRMASGKLVPSGAERSRSRQPRLGVIDVYDLDRTRQLVLLRRDNVEHLLLIGGPNDVVIESNIVRVASGKVNVPAEVSFERPEYSVEPQGRIFPEQQSRPVVESGAFRANTGEAASFAHNQAQMTQQAPVIAPVSVQADHNNHQATIAAASFAAVAAATQYGHEVAEHVETDVPDFLRGQRPSHEPYQPPALEPVFSSGPETAVQESFAETPQYAHHPEPAISQPAAHEAAYAAEPEIKPASPAEPETIDIAGYHALQRAEPEKTETAAAKKHNFTFGGLTNPIGAYAPVLPQRETPPQQEPFFERIPVPETPAALDPVATEPEIEQPVAATENRATPIDETVFSDMARQLEETLKAANAIPVAPVEVHEEISDSPMPEAAAEFPTPVMDKVEDFEPIATAITEETVLQAPEALEEQAQPEAPHGKKPAAAEAEADKKNSDDPFSLDDIEAEFARLLGRSEDKAGKN